MLEAVRKAVAAPPAIPFKQKALLSYVLATAAALLVAKASLATERGVALRLAGVLVRVAGARWLLAPETVTR